MSIEVHRKSVSDAKIASILEAGRAHFLKHGFSRAIVADIACDADVSTATLYKHFRSKEELFAAVVTAAANAAAGYGNLPTAEASAREILTKAAEIYLSVQFDNRVTDLMRILIGEAATAPKLAREMYGVVVERRYESFKAVLDAMVGRGLLRPHDTKLSALFASGIVKELFIWPALFDPEYRRPPDFEQQLREAIELFLARYGA